MRIALYRVLPFMKAEVIGLGKSGNAAARLLKREGWDVRISDRNSSPSLLQQQQDLSQDGISVQLGYSLQLDPSSLPQLIVVSPGVPWDIPVLIQAREQGIETIGEMELAWRHLKSIPWVAVTGTNGKTTTTALIASIFQTAGLNAPACGNIGYAACEVALEQSQFDWIIAEVSSYQSESSPTLSPHIGVWTTFTPDHLSRHKTLENYYNIKAHLLKNSQQQIFNGDDPYLRNIGLTQWDKAYWTSVKGRENLLSESGIYIEDSWVIFQNERIVQVSDLRMVGEHNQQNLLMAIAAAKLANISNNFISEAIRNFPGVPHRLEHICTWEGIDFINDSKATNYDAAEVGLASVISPTILIAGGEAKAGDDNNWIKIIKEKAAFVLLIGSAAPTFSQRLEQANYTKYENVETLERAIPRSAELAKQYNAAVILLSPACASFDQFDNFEQRGDRFRQLALDFVNSKT